MIFISSIKIIILISDRGKFTKHQIITPNEKT